jgi:hypothetical protein
MANELVLVSKGKYEQLLKLAEERRHSEQSGGQLKDRDDIPPVVNLTQDSNISSQNLSSSGDSENFDKHQNPNENVEKPKLYVNKPLSKMPFDSKMSALSGGNNKGKMKTTPQRRKRLYHSREKKGGKSQWINYLV